MLPPLVTPVRGVPWGRFRPPVPRPRVDFQSPPIELPPFQRQVPLRPPIGLPWQPFHVVPPPVHAVTPPAAKLGGDEGFVPRRPGPPIPHVPWLLRNLIASPPGGRVPLPPPPPPDVLPTGVVGQPPLVAPWPDAPDRARRFVDGVSNALNALITAGFLRQTAVDKWEVVAAPGGSGGLTGTFSSGHFGGG